MKSYSEFTNRKDEIGRLLTNFRSGINVTLISPRRWGKSSLVKAVAVKAAKSDRKIKFCFIDLFAIRSEAEFYQALLQIWGSHVFGEDLRGGLGGFCCQALRRHRQSNF